MLKSDGCAEHEDRDRDDEAEDAEDVGICGQEA